MTILSESEKLFYARHFSLPGFTYQTQLRLKDSKVLVIGAGGLGSPCLLYLAGAGIGTLGIVDADTISASNLPRQIMFDYHLCGESKVQQAREKICALNPFVSVNIYNEFLKRDNIRRIFEQYDVIVDCTDNFDAKYLIDEICNEISKPMVYSSIFQYEGQLSVFHYSINDSVKVAYRDLFPVAPDKDFRENCNDAGVIGTLPGTLGTLQANEVIKIITGIGEVLNGRVLIFNILTCQSSVLRVKQRAKKRVVNGFERENIRSTNNVISYQDVIEWCRLGNRFQLIDVRSESERQLLSLGGWHIPLNQLAYKLEEIDQSLPLVIYCQSGARSNRAVMYLTDEGFENVMNLSGGVMRLSEDEILLLSNLYNNIR